jgi:hypothetical protein
MNPSIHQSITPLLAGKERKKKNKVSLSLSLSLPTNDGTKRHPNPDKSTIILVA